MKLTFFKDHKNKDSIMRLGFYTLILCGLIFAFIYPKEHTGYLGILAVAVGMKWQQNKSENA